MWYIMLWTDKKMFTWAVTRNSDHSFHRYTIIKTTDVHHLKTWNYGSPFPAIYDNQNLQDWSIALKNSINIFHISITLLTIIQKEKYNVKYLLFIHCLIHLPTTHNHIWLSTTFFYYTLADITNKQNSYIK